MVSIEDFIIKQKNQTGGNSRELYLPAIKKKDKKLLRFLENKDSNIIKKFVFMHNYLKGIGSSPCTNINGQCLFCQEIVEELNKFDNQYYDWLLNLKITNKTETIRLNDEIISKQKNAAKKVIFNSGEICEIGKFLPKTISTLLTSEELEMYYSFNFNRGRITMKIRSAKFFAPVCTDGEIKIFEFGPGVWNKLDEVFTKAGYDFTSADFLLTHNAIQGNWWIMSKKDSSPLPEDIIAKYAQVKERISAELDRKVKLPTQEEQKKSYDYYRKALNEIDSSTFTSQTEDVKPSAQPAQAAKDLLGEIF